MDALWFIWPLQLQVLQNIDGTELNWVRKFNYFASKPSQKALQKFQEQNQFLAQTYVHYIW